jgi:hypothetical protein
MSADDVESSSEDSDAGIPCDLHEDETWHCDNCETFHPALYECPMTDFVSHDRLPVRCQRETHPRAQGCRKQHSTYQYSATSGFETQMSVSCASSSVAKTMKNMCADDAESSSEDSDAGMPCDFQEVEMWHCTKCKIFHPTLYQCHSPAASWVKTRMQVSSVSQHRPPFNSQLEIDPEGKREGLTCNEEILALELLDQLREEDETLMSMQQALRLSLSASSDPEVDFFGLGHFSPIGENPRTPPRRPKACRKLQFDECFASPPYLEATHITVFSCRSFVPTAEGCNTPPVLPLKTHFSVRSLGQEQAQVDISRYFLDKSVPEEDCASDTDSSDNSDSEAEECYVMDYYSSMQNQRWDRLFDSLKPERMLVASVASVTFKPERKSSASEQLEDVWWWADAALSATYAHIDEMALHLSVDDVLAAYDSLATRRPLHGFSAVFA